MRHLEVRFPCLRLNRLTAQISHTKLAIFLLLSLLASLPAALLASPPASATATTTTLAATVNGTAVTSTSAGTLVTLTATVLNNGAPTTVGLVNFCDTAVSTFCSAIQNAGTAQLTSSGTAVLKFFPGAGVHNYIAQFTGTTAASSSASTPLTLTVNATNPTSTALTALPGSTPGLYSFSSTISSSGGTGYPTGTVSLIDTNTNSALSQALSQIPLTPGTTTLSLTNSSSPATGHEPTYVVSADFNGDGKMDLAIANPGQPGLPNGGPLTILLSNGDGTFTAAPSPATDTIPSVVVAADFNGDGKMDLAVNGNLSGALQILLGNGDGTFTPVSSNPFNPNVLNLAVGDFNHDGFPDVVSINYTSISPSGQLQVLINYGNGDGTFSTSFKPTLPGEPSDIVVGDFNGDGYPDLAVSIGGYPNNSTISILLGQANGYVTAQPNPLTGIGFTTSDSPNTMVVGDFNGDGKADIVITNVPSTPLDNANYAVNIFYGNGDGTFQPTTQITTGEGNSLGMAVGDFNGDGISDLATADDFSTSILLGNKNGISSPTALAPGATTGPDDDTLAVGDFNGDGVPDIAQADSDNNAITVYLTGIATSNTAAFANISIPGTGTHNLLATYSGDASFVSSTSATVAVTASPIATTLVLTSSASSITPGTQVALTATLAPYSQSTLTTNTELVTFYSGSISLGTAALSSGVATFNTTALPAGTDSITATYAGDSSFASATSSAVPVTVAAAPTAPSATLAPGSLTFPAQTTGTVSTAQPVTLTNTAQVPLTVASIQVSGPFAQTNNCGTSVAVGASCTIAVTFNPTVEGALNGTLLVTDGAGTQSVSVTGTGAGLAVTPSVSSLNVASVGTPVTATLQITGVNGFSGSVNLTCAVTYQGQGTPIDPPTCALSPAQVALAIGATASTTLTISTTAAATSSAAHESPWNRSGIAFAALLFLGLVPRRRLRGALFVAVIAFAALGVITGCSSSGNSSGSGNMGPTQPSTTTGNYQVVVTATSGTSTITTPINITVQ